MNNIIALLSSVSDAINSRIWGTPMLVLMLCVGILMSAGTGFFQVFHCRHWLKRSIGSVFSKNSSSRSGGNNHQLSQFQAMCTALASTIGTGNIAGVSTAIAIGGPGAVMWMWISAFFGMMTAYSENVLGIYYRHKGSDGAWCGGPMYYIKEGLGKRRHCRLPASILSLLFCVFCILASFGMGNMAQVNSISTALKSTFGVSPHICGMVVAVIVAFIILGGISRIGRTTEKLVPAMALFYIIGALTIFVMNYRQIPYVFSSIFSNAFSVRSVLGAGTGTLLKRTVTMGFRRGVFSNEAGLGSAVMVHSASDVKEPAVQGMWGIFVVFFDTIVVCTLTAFVLLSATCPAASLQDALSGISKEPVFISIKDSDISRGSVSALVDSQVSANFTPADGSDSDFEVYSVTPSKGIPFDIRVKKEASADSSLTYTNIMSVRGISLDAGGNEVSDPDAPINAVAFEKVEGVPLVTYAFSQKFGSWAGKMIAIAILLFAFSTVVGWSYYGCKAWEYIFGTSSLIVYKMLFVVCVVFGATLNLDLVWSLSDAFNGLMALPNLAALIALSGTVFKITKNYTDRKFRGSTQEPMLSAFSEIQQKQYRAMKSDGEI